MVLEHFCTRNLHTMSIVMFNVGKICIELFEFYVKNHEYVKLHAQINKL